MNKYTTLGFAMLIATTSGCGAIVDKAAERATEEVIEGIVESEGGGDVEIDLDLDGGSGGNITITGQDGEKIEFNSDEEAGTIEISGDDGESLMSMGGELIDGWPSDYLPPGGLNIVTSLMLEGDEPGTVSYTLLFEGGADFEQTVADFESLTQDGAPSSSNDGATNGQRLATRTYELESGITVIFTVSEADDGVSGTFSIANYPKQ